MQYFCLDHKGSRAFIAMNFHANRHPAIRTFVYEIYFYATIHRTWIMVICLSISNSQCLQFNSVWNGLDIGNPSRLLAASNEVAISRSVWLMRKRSGGFDDFTVTDRSWSNDGNWYSWRKIGLNLCTIWLPLLTQRKTYNIFYLTPIILSAIMIIARGVNLTIKKSQAPNKIN